MSTIGQEISNAKLIPLQQWICDSCGETIKGAQDGYLEWKKDYKSNWREKLEFRIVHNLHSCLYSNDDRGADLPLIHVTGVDGLVHLLSWIDVGEYLEPEYRQPSVRDLRDWTEVVRRLYVPYYEEARRYFQEAQLDGFFDGTNEVFMYCQETLIALIERYGNKE